MVDVLQSKDQYTDARLILKKKGINCMSGICTRLLCKLKILEKVPIGDKTKSWDVLKTVQFIQNHLVVDSTILDIGAYGSEILCILHKLGFKNLWGIDLNRKIDQMPFREAVHYLVGNFMQTSFKSGSFDAITAISVIEHGFEPDRLLHELSRIIKPGGYFIASVDYWPEKVNTSGMTAFGIDWTIFSEHELKTFFDKAASYGFAVCGNASFFASAPVIKWYGKQYTFAWFVLQKKA